MCIGVYLYFLSEDVNVESVFIYMVLLVKTFCMVIRITIVTAMLQK